MKVKSESEVTQSCLTLRDPMDWSLPGSSVHGIFQARVLEWGAIAFSVTSTKCVRLAWVIIEGTYEKFSQKMFNLYKYFLKCHTCLHKKTENLKKVPTQVLLVHVDRWWDGREQGQATCLRPLSSKNKVSWSWSFIFISIPVLLLWNFFACPCSLLQRLSIK